MQLQHDYDPVSDTITIEGVKYSGDLFRCFYLGPSDPVRLLRIIEKSENGVVTVHSYTVDLEKFETWHREQEEQRLKELAEAP